MKIYRVVRCVTFVNRYKYLWTERTFRTNTNHMKGDFIDPTRVHYLTPKSFSTVGFGSGICCSVEFIVCVCVRACVSRYGLFGQLLGRYIQHREPDTPITEPNQLASRCTHTHSLPTSDPQPHEK